MQYLTVLSLDGDVHPGHLLALRDSLENRIRRIGNAAALQDTVKKTKWVLELVQGLIAESDASCEALQAQHATELVRTIHNFLAHHTADCLQFLHTLSLVAGCGHCSAT